MADGDSSGHAPGESEAIFGAADPIGAGGVHDGGGASMDFAASGALPSFAELVECLQPQPNRRGFVPTIDNARAAAALMLVHDPSASPQIVCARCGVPSFSGRVRALADAIVELGFECVRLPDEWIAHELPDAPQPTAHGKAKHTPPSHQAGAVQGRAERRLRSLTFDSDEGAPAAGRGRLEAAADVQWQALRRFWALVTPGERPDCDRPRDAGPVVMDAALRRQAQLITCEFEAARRVVQQELQLNLARSRRYQEAVSEILDALCELQHLHLGSRLAYVNVYDPDRLRRHELVIVGRTSAGYYGPRGEAATEEELASCEERLAAAERTLRQLRAAGEVPHTHVPSWTGAECVGDRDRVWQYSDAEKQLDETLLRVRGVPGPGPLPLLPCPKLPSHRACRPEGRDPPGGYAYRYPPRCPTAAPGCAAVQLAPVVEAAAAAPVGAAQEAQPEVEGAAAAAAARRTVQRDEARAPEEAATQADRDRVRNARRRAEVEAAAEQVASGCDAEMAEAVAQLSVAATLEGLGELTRTARGREVQLPPPVQADLAAGLAAYLFGGCGGPRDTSGPPTSRADSSTAEDAGGAADLEGTGAAARPNRRAGGKNRAARRRAAERRRGS